MNESRLSNGKSPLRMNFGGSSSQAQKTTGVQIQPRGVSDTPPVVKIPPPAPNRLFHLFPTRKTELLSVNTANIYSRDSSFWCVCGSTDAHQLTHTRKLFTTKLLVIYSAEHD